MFEPLAAKCQRIERNLQPRNTSSCGDGEPTIMFAVEDFELDFDLDFDDEFDFTWDETFAFLCDFDFFPALVASSGTACS